LNLLLISPFFSPNIGGVETHLDDLCSYLSSKGHVVEVITYQPLTAQLKAPGKEAKGNVLVHRYKWFDTRPFLVSERLRMLELPLLFPGLFFATLLFLLRNHRNIDLIHCHGFVAGSIANLLSPIFRKPYIVSVHWVIGNERLGNSRIMLTRLLSRARVILTMSKTAAEEMVAVGFPKERIRCFTYWVDLSRFRPEDKKLSKRMLGVQNKILILYVGRLIEGKGIMTFLEVAKTFERRDTLMFGVIGTGTLDSKISEYCQNHSNMIFYGPVPNEHLPLYYNSADLVIVPSIHREGFPRVIVESLSCGTPVLASSRAVSDGLSDTVAVICNHDSQSIASKLDFLLDNTRFLESPARRCRDFSTRHFGMDNARAIEEAYSWARRSLNSS
jgi:glycosyltransferase involved in cell wall biosynthesis